MRMLAAARPNAHQPYAAIPVAAPQSGATAMRSRATSQMQTYGPKLTSIETAESAQPRYVSVLRGPAKASRRLTAPLPRASLALVA